MAADVTTIVRMMEAHREDDDGKRRGIVTRDLLGDAAVAAAVGSSTELDLDLQVPSGWERRLDLKSGKTFLHRLYSDLPSRELHDLNLPPPSSSSSASLPEHSTLLDLKLAGGGISNEYQSVCTLEKVKSALERAHRRQIDWETGCASGSPSSSTTSSSMKRVGVAEEDDGGSDSTGGLLAAACPSCLLYVLISKASPRCPRCDSHVPVPVPFLPKRPRFDLNSS
ncbi:hypothetical protein IEQ34_013225 [Dendrobium chrysotoxum]|uniref:GIR1-like zinc ribbon domain-containing protein n=1 Tax=Dendrobium chrysotoxum TaxID=161865 RepID=A0AAV7GQZ2_DENCH|nr:hypothetical protein IEQ34_013225 [Dendrobium chrysotoxum]